MSNAVGEIYGVTQKGWVGHPLSIGCFLREKLACIEEW